MKKLACVVAAISALGVFACPAGAETKTFDSPKLGTNLLDWCVNWGTGCGEPAATAWCKTNGFDHAVSVTQAIDVGAKTPTRLIETGEVCDQSYCDGFTSITCVGAEAPPAPEPAPAPAVPEAVEETPPPAADVAEQTFKNPMFNDIRLNWCLDGSKGCGKQAAEVWCAQQEFSTATNFKYVSGIKPTIQIGTGKSTKTAGKAFSRITCVK